MNYFQRELIELGIYTLTTKKYLDTCDGKEKLTLFKINS